MPLNRQAGQATGDKDALERVNPITAILYLFVVAFVFTAILPGLH
jgi:hypothetical protein